jgi:hypothetical protein
MVIDDLDIFGTSSGPAEADPILIVDSDRVLPSPITLQLLEAQAWKREGLQGPAEFKRSRLLAPFS